VPLVFVAQALPEWLVYSLSAAGSAALVYVALFSRRRWVQGVMTSRFLVYTGTIS